MIMALVSTLAVGCGGVTQREQHDRAVALLARVTTGLMDSQEALELVNAARHAAEGR